jgi:hypothetical protein
LPGHHDWLVVTGLVVPELLDEELELFDEELALLDELAVLDEAAVLLEPVPAVLAELVLAVVAVLPASAGSCPETSCTKIIAHRARNTVAAIVTTRLRIAATRRRRTSSRSATRGSTVRGCGLGRGRRAAGFGRAWLYPSGGVMVGSISSTGDYGRAAVSERREEDLRNAYEPERRPAWPAEVTRSRAGCEPGEVGTGADSWAREPTRC